MANTNIASSDLIDISETYAKALADARGGQLPSHLFLRNGLLGKLSVLALLVAGGTTALYFLRQGRLRSRLLHEQLTDELSRRDQRAIDMNIAS